MWKTPLTLLEYYLHWRNILYLSLFGLMSGYVFVQWMLGKISSGGVPLLLFVLTAGPPIFLYLSWRVRDY